MVSRYAIASVLVLALMACGGRGFSGTSPANQGPSPQSSPTSAPTPTPGGGVGGGGGGGGGSTPTPSPTPTGAPTPTPTGTPTPTPTGTPTPTPTPTGAPTPTPTGTPTPTPTGTPTPSPTPTGTPAPSPTPTPGPTPSPTPAPGGSFTINGTLTVDHDFSVGSQVFAHVSSSTGQTSDASSQPRPLSISYDAATGTYLLTGGSVSDAFGPGDRSDGGGNSGIARYAAGPADEPHYLTIVTRPPGRTEPNRYVALGLWQHDGQGGADYYDFFAFGFPTPPGGLPRSGQLTYQIDVSGIVTAIGAQAASFAGQGSFVVDLATGQFLTQATLSESDLLSGTGIADALLLSGSGSITSDHTGFNGSIVYQGHTAVVPGTMTGLFYGPAGEELGATFGGSDASGGTIVGAMTGQR